MATKLQHAHNIMKVNPYLRNYTRFNSTIWDIRAFLKKQKIDHLEQYIIPYLSKAIKPICIHLVDEVCAVKYARRVSKILNLQLLPYISYSNTEGIYYKDSVVVINLTAYAFKDIDILYTIKRAKLTLSQ